MMNKTAKTYMLFKVRGEIMMKSMFLILGSLVLLVAMVCEADKKHSFDDSEKILDDKVVASALALGKNPKNYRMHMRTDLDGVKIYRQIGKYVLEDPRGEVIFVPDRK
jgi:hypothetical protein